MQDAPIKHSVAATCLTIAGLLVVLYWPNPLGEDVSPERTFQPALQFPWAPRHQPLVFSASPTRSLTQRVARQQLGVKLPDVRLVVDLSDRRVYVYQQGQQSASYPIAIGQAGWETPTGKFQVTSLEKNPRWRHPLTHEWVPPGPDSPLGVRWIGFWEDTHSEIGFHGTNQEDLLGEAASHGCIRMRNRDITTLFDQIAIGTPVIVQP